jgi:hypothetical protein
MVTGINFIYLNIFPYPTMRAGLFVLALALVLAVVPMATAESDPYVVNDCRTQVSGIVYDASQSPVDGANVKVVCENNVLNTLTTTDGSYYVTYDCDKCSEGFVANVYADKNGQAGSNIGTVYHWSNSTTEMTFGNVEVVFNQDNNGAVVPVTIPEFGFAAAGAVLIGSVVLFAVMRRN